MHSLGSNPRFTGEETEGNEGAPGGSVHLVYMSSAVCPTLSPDLTVLRLLLQLCHPPFSILLCPGRLTHGFSITQAPCLVVMVGFIHWEHWQGIGGRKKRGGSAPQMPCLPGLGLAVAGSSLEDHGSSGGPLLQALLVLIVAASASRAGRGMGFPPGLVLGASLYPDGFP